MDFSYFLPLSRLFSKAEGIHQKTLDKTKQPGKPGCKGPWQIPQTATVSKCEPIVKPKEFSQTNHRHPGLLAILAALVRWTWNHWDLLQNSEKGQIISHAFNPVLPLKPLDSLTNVLTIKPRVSLGPMQNTEQSLENHVCFPIGKWPLAYSEANDMNQVGDYAPTAHQMGTGKVLKTISVQNGPKRL